MYMTEQTRSNTNDPTRPMLSVAGAAELANVNRQTLYRLLKSGEVKATRIRNTWRIPRKAFCEQFGIED